MKMLTRILSARRFSSTGLKYGIGRYKPLFNHSSTFHQFSLNYSASSQQSLQESIMASVEAKNYQQIPDLLNTSVHSTQDANPFAFLSTSCESQRIHIVDEILQFFIRIRPRSRPCLAYSHLLSYTLESPNPLPLALAVLQQMLRSGCLPGTRTHFLLSHVWLKRRDRSQSVSSILLEMHAVGYSVDCGTCNYLIQSLCKFNRLDEAVKVLRGMGRAGCIPDLDGYGALISEMSENRMISEVMEMVKEMVVVHGLNPRQDVVVKAVDAMRGNRDVWRAVEMIEFLEREDVQIGFEAYESVLEGCLECRQFVLAGKFVIRMTERGFIPYIRVRQRLVEGLVGVGELELASVMRQRLAELKS